jgi:hypothetical protein
MAAIDKLYVHSYYEYDDLRRWAIAYYPELLFHFYDITMTYQRWEDNCRAYAKQHIAIAKMDYEKLGDFNGDQIIGVANLMEHYKKTTGYDCPLEQAQEEAFAIIDAYKRTAGDWGNLYSCPIMNTPFDVDKKLLWICPVHCVRKYLEEHCGYKTKWYHKLFWKGKKHFC